MVAGWRNLAEPSRPSSAVPRWQKAAFTAGSLAVFLVGSHQPLYLYETGVRYMPARVAADPLYWLLRGVRASNNDSIMAFGVAPLLLSECTVHFWLGRKIKDRTLLNRVQKLLGILTFGVAVINVLGSSIAIELTTKDAILAVLQLFFGGLVVIYLDQVLQRGPGFLSSIPLFTTANICTNMFCEAFSPYITYGGGLGRRILVSSLFHRLIASGENEFSAMNKALSHWNLPNVANMVATCVFFLIVLILQGLYVKLPVRSHKNPKLQVNYMIRTSYLSFAVLVFQNVTVSSMYLIPQFLYETFCGNNIVVNLMGKWKESKYFGQAVPVSGIAYYVTTPPTFADVGRDPVYTFTYAVLLLLICASCSTAFFEVCAYSDRYLARLLGKPLSVTVAQANSVPQKLWRRYVAKVAFLVGLSVGGLTLVAGLAGVIGSGTGIMFVVTVIYSCFYERTRRVGASGAGAFGF